MDPAPLVTLLGLLLVKEAGVPIPVPGDLLVLGAGIAATGHGLDAAAELVAIVLVGYVGGGVQFGLVRGTLRRPLLRILARVGVPPARLDALAAWLKERGARGVALARMTPGLRVGAIAASGLAALRYPVFLRGLAVGNAVFVGGHFLLGYAIGAPALRLIGDAGGAVPAVAAALVVAAVGAAGWRRLGRGSRARRGVTARAAMAMEVPARPPTAAGSPTPVDTEAISGPISGWGREFGDWADAACPACLALAFLDRSRAT